MTTAGQATPQEGSPCDSAVTLARGASIGHYEIVESIGSGGMGVVYRAHDSRLARDVAVKVIAGHLASDPGARLRFEREARAVAALSHPNILAIHEFGIEQDTPYAVTELLQSESLRARLARGPLPWRDAVDLAIAAANGLAAAHARGIVHRDLKPENVFLTSDGQLKVLDFGLARTDAARVWPQAAESPTMAETQPGAIVGTIRVSRARAGARRCRHGGERRLRARLHRVRDDLPRHEFRRGIELPKHSLEGRSYDRRRRVAADDFIQGSNDRIVGNIHVDSVLKCRSNVNGKTLNSGTARNSAREISPARSASRVRIGSTLSRIRNSRSSLTGTPSWLRSPHPQAHRLADHRAQRGPKHVHEALDVVRLPLENVESGDRPATSHEERRVGGEVTLRSFEIWPTSDRKNRRPGKRACGCTPDRRRVPVMP